MFCHQKVIYHLKRVVRNFTSQKLQNSILSIKIKPNKENTVDFREPDKKINNPEIKDEDSNNCEATDNTIDHEHSNNCEATDNTIDEFDIISNIKYCQLNINDNEMFQLPNE